MMEGKRSLTDQTKHQAITAHAVVMFKCAACECVFEFHTPNFLDENAMAAFDPVWAICPHCKCRAEMDASVD